MPNADSLLPCDGCGQLAAPGHISRRLQRLEWATRFRPVHIQTLLLGGIPPANDAEYLYCPEGGLTGEAQTILQAVQVSAEGKPREVALAEFQKLGLMLTHVLECPLDSGLCAPESAAALFEKRLLATVARIRRSLKPKRIVFFSIPARLAEQLRRTDLGCPSLPTAEPPPGSQGFADAAFEALRTALVASDG